MGTIYWEDMHVKDPALYAVLIGVSNYPYASNGKAAVAETHGIRQLAAPANTVKDIADWLIKNKDNLFLPLKSIHLLASPSSLEVIEDKSNSLKQLVPATLKNVQSTLIDWRKASSLSPENGTIFYFGGHGIQQSRGDSILLLEDFLGQDSENILENAVNVSNIYNGMANFESIPNLPKTQVYFIDACRADLINLGKFEAYQPSSVFKIEVGGTDDRTAPIFFASAAGHETYSIIGQKTFFGRDLLDCLDGAAGDKIALLNGKRGWYVTVGTLAEAMSKLVNYHNANSPLGRACPRSLNIDKLNSLSSEQSICELGKVPSVRCYLNFDPDEAAKCASVKFDSPNLNLAERMDGPFENPFLCSKPAGIYAIDAVVPATMKPKLRDLPEELVNVRGPFFNYALSFHS